MTEPTASTGEETPSAGICAADIRDAIDWLGGWGDSIEFNQSIWTKNEDDTFDGGVWLVGKVKATGEYVEAKYVLDEATVSPAEDLFEMDDEEDEDD